MTTHDSRRTTHDSPFRRTPQTAHPEASRARPAQPSATTRNESSSADPMARVTARDSASLAPAGAFMAPSLERSGASAWRTVGETAAASRRRSSARLNAEDATIPNTAIASSAARRATALLMPEAAPACVRPDGVQDRRGERSDDDGHAQAQQREPRKKRSRIGRAGLAGREQEVARGGDQRPDRQREARSDSVGELSRGARQQRDQHDERKHGRPRGRRRIAARLDQHERQEEQGRRERGVEKERQQVGGRERADAKERRRDHRRAGATARRARRRPAPRRPPRRSRRRADLPSRPSGLRSDRRPAPPRPRVARSAPASPGAARRAAASRRPWSRRSPARRRRSAGSGRRRRARRSSPRAIPRAPARSPWRPP